MNHRWELLADINLVGAVTISDLCPWLVWVFFVPGDGIIYFLSRYQATATFLEITPGTYGNWATGLMSSAAWLIGAYCALLVTVAIISAIFETVPEAPGNS
jgi:hypothetical protein